MKQKLIITITAIQVGILSLLTTDAYSAANNKAFDTQKAVLVHADTIDYDYNHGVVRARGNVVLHHMDQTLRADVVNYDQPNNLVTASGNVSITQPTKDVLFANYMELTDDLKDGFIDEVKVILANDAKLAAVTAKQFDEGNRTQMNKAVYSACKVCKTDPSVPPLWQLKSETILWEHKEGEPKDIIYTDASMEMFGYPIFWTPYFRHPDPSVKRRSGFLAPVFGTTPSTGFGIMTPYFIEWDNDKDVTLKPLITTKSDLLLGAQYRQQLQKGRIQLDGSIARAKKYVNKKLEESTRWHTEGYFRHDLSDDWRMGINAVRASDPTYLREFSVFTSSPKTFINRTLDKGYGSVYESQIFVEGFKNRSYANMSAMAFQGIRQGDQQKNIPYILPMIDVNYMSNQFSNGTKVRWDNHMVNLQREKGTDVSSLSSNLGGDFVFHTPLGGVNKLSASMRGDIYNREDFMPIALGGTKHDGFIGRTFPQAILEWKYPFVKQMENGQIVVEPLVNIIGAPKVGDQLKVPNEDSFIIEPTDLSFYDGNRFPGYDIIDDGSRFNYGLNIDCFNNKMGSLGILVGQTYSFTEPSIAQSMASDVNKEWSDFLGRVNYIANPYLDINYRFRLDKNNFAPKRNELSLSAGAPIFRVYTDFIMLPKYRDDISESTRQLDLGASSQFTENWTVKVGTTRELGKNKGPLEHRIGLAFTNECFTFETTAFKSFYKDRELKPGKSIFFRIVFVTLGEVSYKYNFGSGTDRNTSEMDRLLKRS